MELLRWSTKEGRERYVSINLVSLRVRGFLRKRSLWSIFPLGYCVIAVGLTLNVYFDSPSDIDLFWIVGGKKRHLSNLAWLNANIMMSA